MLHSLNFKQWRNLRKQVIWQNLRVFDDDNMIVQPQMNWLLQVSSFEVSVRNSMLNYSSQVWNEQWR